MSYRLTPETDPTAFERDGKTYHLCDLPGPNHQHHVQFPYAACYEEDWATATPEQKASWVKEARESLERYSRNG
jgi:hypothetical protein